MIDTSLFGELQVSAVQRAAEGPFAAVAIERSLDKVLDYSVPAGLVENLAVGQRVSVPLGRNNRPQHGYVISIQATSDYPKVKPIMAIDDRRILLPPKTMELACWMARYYCTPLGTVIDSIIPSAVEKKIGFGGAHPGRLGKKAGGVQETFEENRAGQP